MKPKSISHLATFTLLGTGTSTGVPILGCSCRVCRSRNPKNHRLRVSGWLQTAKASIVIDTSIDFRAQALRAKIHRVDAVLYTHPHADHVGGIDDLRAFNFLQKGVIPVYGNSWTERDLLSRYSYVFDHLPSLGGGKPQLEFRSIPDQGQDLEVHGLKVRAIGLPHGNDSVLAFRVGELGYVTDTHDVTEKALRDLSGVKVLVLDCVRTSPHRTHLNLEKALEVSSRIGAEKTFLTHLGHEFEWTEMKKKLPRGIYLGFDGQKMRFSAKMESGR